MLQVLLTGQLERDWLRVTLAHRNGHAAVSLGKSRIQQALSFT